MNEEIFKELTWTDGRYYVSNYGNVKSVGGKKNKRKKYTIMKTQINNNGYKFLKLFYNGKHHTFLVHRLVAIAFMGEHEGMDINHKDGNKLNNRLENLEWCTRKENMKHCTLNGLRSDIKKVIAIKKGKAVSKGYHSRDLAEKMIKENLIPKETNIETFARQVRKKIDSEKPYKGFFFVSI